MECPPDLSQSPLRSEYYEQMRIHREAMKCKTEAHRINAKYADQPHECYERSSCGCHCGAKCEACAHEITVNFLRLHLKKPHHLKAEEGTEYAFTLTMPPDYQPVKPLTEVARNIMEHGITNKPYEKPIKWAYVLEHTEQGTPHIHGVYRTASGRRLAAKYFKRYWPLWDETKPMGNGHQGGYHQKARHNQSYAAYLLKEGDVISSDPIILAEEISMP